MYLTLLKPEHTKENANMIFNDRQKLHKKIQEEGFGCRREESNSLYTIIRDGRQPYLLLSSTFKPDKIKDMNEIDSMKDPYKFIENGSIIQIEANLSPSKSQSGKRRYIKSIEERIEWVGRQMEKAGATLLKCNELESIETAFFRKETKKLVSQDGYKYSAILRIEDKNTFKTYLEKGVGSGKAYGFGMIKIISVLA